MPRIVNVHWDLGLYCVEFDGGTCLRNPTAWYSDIRDVLALLASYDRMRSPRPMSKSGERPNES